MAVGLVFQFAKARRDSYDRVNRLLGIDMKRGTGNWPSGLLSNAAGTSADGGLVVMEVWESRAALDRFMSDRLGPAIQKAGIDNVPRMTWVDAVSYHTPGKEAGEVEGKRVPGLPARALIVEDRNGCRTGAAIRKHIAR